MLKSIWRREAVCAALAGLFSHYLMHYHLTSAVQLPFANLEQLLAFSTPKPFCYRVFSPFCLRLGTTLGLSPETAVAVFEWVSLVTLYAVFRVYLRQFLSSTQAAFAALAVYFVLPFLFIIPKPLTIWLPWDIPSACFFTAGLLCLCQERWYAWYPVFVLGTLNRETTIFLLPVMWLQFRRRGLSRSRLGHVVLSSLVWLSVKAILIWVFRNQNGPWLAEWHQYDLGQPHWRENLQQFGMLHMWPYLLSAVGFLWLLAWYGKSSLESPFLRSALAVVPLYFVFLFLFANLTEHRVYSDFIPLLLTPVLVASLSGDLSHGRGRKASPA